MVLTADRLGLAASQVSPGRLSGGQGGDLGLVVGEGSVSDPDSGSFGAVEPAAVPALATYQGADPALAFGSPFDGSSDPPSGVRRHVGLWLVCLCRDDVLRTPWSCKASSTPCSP